MIDLTRGESKFRKIYEDVETHIENIISEEDSKVQLINRILTESLGWSHTDISCETKQDSGFSDYVLSIRSNLSLIIEAKRIGIINIETAEKEKVRYLKISGSTLKSALPGIDQAVSYALPNGLNIAVLTDGIAWVIFKTFIPGENFKSKSAIVFPSMEAILKNYSSFFELLAKNNFSKKLYNSIFDEIHNNRLLLTQELKAPIEPGEIKLLPKSNIAFDLERVFNNFFSKLTEDSDQDLLIECFVETRESRIADFSLEKITKSVLGNILPSNKSVDDELANLIRENIEINGENSTVESGQTIFIVGPTGAGKSTFLDRFFIKTLPNAIRKKCAVIKVNCLDATGSNETLLPWITETVIESLEGIIYNDGAPSWDELLGLYIGEYRRRAKGVDAELYKNDKDKFKLKFSEFLDRKVEEDRETYLKRILLDVVHNRKMLPVLIIDNSDEFSNSYKEQIFQFSQALKRHAKHCLVIFPVTDKSAWSFSKTDIYGIYKSRSFFLPTPSPKEVFRKRIDFLKEKINSEEIDIKERGNYFLSKGIKISIDNLDGFAKVLENIFVDQDYTSKTLGELTNYNIRRTLILSQRIITSSVFKIEDLIKSYLGSEPITTNFTKFILGLMMGNYDLYKQGDNHEIFPIFQVDNKIKQSPLLNLRVLTLLDSQRRGSRTIEDKHLSITSIIEYFDSIGCSEQAIDKALLSLLEAGLVEPYDISNSSLTSDQKLSISYRGQAHLRLAIHNSVFFSQMALTTAILDEEAALKIRSLNNSNQDFLSRISQIKMEFLNYLVKEDQQFISIESELSQYESQKELLRNLNKYHINTATIENDLVATLGEEYKEGIIKKNVPGIVDFFDNYKGYGFVEVDDFDNKVYINEKQLSNFNDRVLTDGDLILCDVGRSTKGFYVTNVHEIVTDEIETNIVECKVIRVFPERGYGFVFIEDKKLDAYFHLSIFPSNIRPDVKEGDSIKAEIGPDYNSDGFKIKRFFEFI